MIVWYTLHIIFDCAITNKKAFISFFHSTTIAYCSEKCKQKVCAIPTHKAYWIFHNPQNGAMRRHPSRKKLTTKWKSIEKHNISINYQNGFVRVRLRFHNQQSKYMQNDCMEFFNHIKPVSWYVYHHLAPTLFGSLARSFCWSENRSKTTNIFN